MQQSIDTCRLVVVSTGHVREETAKLLDTIPCRNWPFAGGPYAEFGWFAYAHEENTGVGQNHIPEELFAMMTWARRNGFDYLLFDRDGGRVDDLPFFGW